MADLHLNLYRKWFDLTKDQIKKEEYRELTSYWYSRLLNRDLRAMKKGQLAIFMQMIIDNKIEDDVWPIIQEAFSPDCFKKFDKSIVSNGYKKDRPQFSIEFKGVKIDKGNPEWGADPNKYYFVIMHGNLIP